MTTEMHGLIIGKFLPPHLGHVHLVDFARNWSDQRTTVVVCSLRREPIAGAVRLAWMRELFPNLNVVHLDEELPQKPSEHPDFWPLWRRALSRVVGRPVTHVFGSDAYIHRLAQELNAVAVPVDPSRSVVTVSGTAIRVDPMRHWEHLPACVRPHFVRRVCIFGPESTGKTTLARFLAEKLGTVWVPEYARTWLEAKHGSVVPSDMPLIVRGQIASEQALARQANRVLILDTDALATVLWSRALFDDVDSAVAAAADTHPSDLYLLTNVDVPFVPDQVRYLPEQRATFHAACERELSRRHRRFVHLRGSWEKRQADAIDAIRGLCAPT